MRPASVTVPPDGRVVLDAGLLKDLRKTRGMSQEALAELCFHRSLSVSVASIKRAETGKPVLYRTARHLATVYGIELASLSAAAAPAAPPQPPPQEQAAPAAVRYVVELHVAHGAPPAAVQAALLRRHGGEAGGHPGLIRFGLRQAHDSDLERALRCAAALREAATAGCGVVLALGRQDHGAAPPAPLAGRLRVAASLAARLDGLADFGPVEDGYRDCLRLLPPDGRRQPALCGRTLELQQIRGVLEASQECQDGHIIYLRGAAGVGKSRLLAEAATQARLAGFACHQAEVLDFGMEDWYSPLSQLVRALQAGAGEGWQLPADSAVWLAWLAGVALAPAQLEQCAALAPPARQQGLAAAVRALLLRAALQQPLLVCIEDLHWGAPQLHGVLVDLLAGLAEAPIVWLLTARQDGDPLEQALRPRCAHPLTLLDLGPMRPREAAALAQQYGEVAPAVRARCIELAQGNPLYLTQLLAEPGQQLPDSLRHLVQSRLDRLEAAQQQALRAAAVIGARFELALLRAVLAAPDYRPCARACPGLVRETEAGRYAFVHDLVLHGIYDAMTDSERARLHRAVARQYAGPGGNPQLYAQHLLRAADPAAFEALLCAMQDKLAAYQYDSALALAGQCEQFAPQARASFTLALLQGHAQAGLGATARARHSYQRALMLSEGAADKLEVALGLAPVLNTLGSLEEEEQLLELALPLAAQLGRHGAQARLYQLQGGICFPRGEHARGRERHEQALRHARLAGDAESEVRALSGIGDAYYAEGRMAEAHRTFAHCVALCERHGLAGVDAVNRSARASAALYLGQPQAALEDAAEAVRRARLVGDRRAEVFARLTASWVLVAGGAAARAGQELGLAIELARSLGTARFEAILLEGLARVAYAEGRQAQAGQHLAQAAALVESQQLQRYCGPWVYASLALLSSQPGARTLALRRAQAQLGHGALAHNGLRFQLAAAELALLDGDGGRAASHAAALAGLGDGCAWSTLHAELIGHAGAWLAAPGAVHGHALRRALARCAEAGYTATMPRLLERLGPEFAPAGAPQLAP